MSQTNEESLARLIASIDAALVEHMQTNQQIDLESLTQQVAKANPGHSTEDILSIINSYLSSFLHNAGEGEYGFPFFGEGEDALYDYAFSDFQ